MVAVAFSDGLREQEVREVDKGRSASTFLVKAINEPCGFRNELVAECIDLEKLNIARIYLLD